MVSSRLIFLRTLTGEELLPALPARGMVKYDSIGGRGLGGDIMLEWLMREEIDKVDDDVEGGVEVVAEYGFF